MSDLSFDDDGDLLDLISATSEIGLWQLDISSGKALRNRRHDQIFGYEALLDDWSAETFLTYVFEEDRGRVQDLLETSVKEGRPWSFETQIRRADGVDRWISAKGMPKFDDKGDVRKLIGHVIDITETKQNEDRLKLLSKELNHRVGNTFAIMNSIVRHTAKKSTSVQEFAETLLERLGALARANRVLVADESERSSLGEILDMELAAFANWRACVIVSGETQVWFSGEASEALAMVFHELLTNAVKHGALSVPTGQVGVNVATCGLRKVHIKWTESGGPAIPSGRRFGIGSSIMQNAMRDQGSLELDYSGDGLVCDITVNDSYRRKAGDVPAPPLSALPSVQRPELDGAFSGRRIMVVEDETIIGMDISDILRSRGAIVIGPFTTVETALNSLRDRPDAALLDVNLGQETTEAIAVQLRDLSIPFLIVSGMLDSTNLRDAFHGAPIIAKPFGEHDLVHQVANLFL